MQAGWEPAEPALERTQAAEPALERTQAAGWHRHGRPASARPPRIEAC